jgi:hypothetical protein
VTDPALRTAALRAVAGAVLLGAAGCAASWAVRLVILAAAGERTAAALLAGLAAGLASAGLLLSAWQLLRGLIAPH